MLKNVFSLIGISILDQINLSLKFECVPQLLKVTAIKPILKKPSLNPELFVNYRPKSKLSFITKTLKKLVASQLGDHLHINYLCVYLQPITAVFPSGFRIHHRTEAASLTVTNDHCTASDSGLVSTLVLLDLNAAFDTLAALKERIS